MNHWERLISKEFGIYESRIFSQNNVQKTIQKQRTHWRCQATENIQLLESSISERKTFIFCLLFSPRIDYSIIFLFLIKKTLGSRQFVCILTEQVFFLLFVYTRALQCETLKTSFPLIHPHKSFMCFSSISMSSSNQVECWRNGKEMVIHDFQCSSPTTSAQVEAILWPTGLSNAKSWNASGFTIIQNIRIKKVKSSTGRSSQQLYELSILGYKRRRRR